MKVTTLLLIGVAALVVYNYTGLGIAANDIQVVLGGFKINSISDFQLTLIIQNPTNAVIKVNSMVGNVTINGNNLGNLSSFIQVTVPANSQRPVVLHFSPSLLSLPADIKNLIDAGSATYTVEATGYINVTGIPAPISFDETDTFTI